MVSARARAGRGRRSVPAWLALAVVVLSQLVVTVRSSEPASAAVPSGFTETTAFSGLRNPTAVEFAPDGRVFVAEKRGTVQMFDGPADTTPTQVADLRTEVYNFWDRGLLGLAIDPGFPARPYLYVTYTFDGVIGGSAPLWGSAGADSDSCPNPPGATTSGCVASGKLARLTLDGTTTTKQDLIHDWCQQFPSHTVGDLVFGRDGALYVSGGDGASFSTRDHGQLGTPINPCGDPGQVGGSMNPPGAEGGALRSQDVRTTGDPTGLSGSVIRVSPDTGAALPDNPAAASSDPNTRRIIAHGLRNPFRMAQRPGTDEMWLGDVGWDTWEEVNRIAAPTQRVVNFGWPCYEGDDRNAAYDGANLKLCEDLYGLGNADTKPHFRYRHGEPPTPDDGCNTARGASVSGVAFQFSAGGPYPAAYDGALFVSDFSRGCIWVIGRGANGQPDVGTIKPFVSQAAAPVDLELSPGGELFYADFSGGTIRRIAYSGSAPTTCAAGQLRAEYFANRTLSGAPATTVCEAAPLDHDWGGGSPMGVGPDSFSARFTGSFNVSGAGPYTFTARADDGIRVWVDDALLIDQWSDQSATTFTATRTLTAGAHALRVEYYDAAFDAVAELSWSAGAANAPPQPQIAGPDGATTWKVGDTITFSGTATDPEDGTLPATALTWEMVLQHCPLQCHGHPLQTWTGVAGGSIAAPDHDHPSHLELRLTATDSRGVAATVATRLDPQTVAITVASQPPGLQLTVGQRTATAPFTSTMIAGSTTSISAPSPQTSAGTSQVFARWSDGGGQTHDITAGTDAATFTATYSGVAPTTCPVGQYRAEYFSNMTLAGAPTSTVCEAAPLSKSFGAGGPAGVGVDRFSARWSGSFDFATAGTYAFTAVADDGVRVWVDGVVLVDQWRDQPASTFTATRSLTAGRHEVRVEYFENGYDAVARLSWARV